MNPAPLARWLHGFFHEWLIFNLGAYAPASFVLE